MNDVSQNVSISLDRDLFEEVTRNLLYARVRNGRRDHLGLIEKDALGAQGGRPGYPLIATRCRPRYLR